MSFLFFMFVHFYYQKHEQKRKIMLENMKNNAYNKEESPSKNQGLYKRKGG